MARINGVSSGQAGLYIWDSARTGAGGCSLRPGGLARTRVTERAVIRGYGHNVEIAADDGGRGVCMNQITGPPSGARCSATVWKPRDW